MKIVDVVNIKSKLFEGNHTYFQENWTLNLKLWPSSNMSGFPNMYIRNRLCIWISRVRRVLKVFDFLALGVLPTIITHSEGKCLRESVFASMVMFTVVIR